MSTYSIAQSTTSFSSISEINVMATLQVWMNRHAQRKQLAQLNDTQLADIGLTRQEALVEAKTPFWK